MAGLGTIVNVIAVAGGCVLGLLFKRLISEKMNEMLTQALALGTIAIGITGIVQGGIALSDSGLSSRYTLVMLLSLVIGTFLGQLIDIDRRLEALGQAVEKKLVACGNGDFSRGFVAATLTFCVGSMAVVGALNDGLSQNPDMLFAKSVLDFTASIVYASALGAGALFSVIPLGLYQGGITLFASFLKPFLTETAISQMSFIGSILIMGIGLSFVYKPKLRLANMLPALIIPFVWQAIIK